MIKQLLRLTTPLAFLAAAALITGCSSDDDNTSSGGLSAPDGLGAWSGVVFEFNPTVSINGAQITFDNGFTFDFDGNSYEIDPGSAFSVFWERMSDAYGNLLIDVGGEYELRFSVGEFQGSADAITSFTLGAYFNDDPIEEYQNVTATVIEGTLKPGGKDPFDPDPIGTQYETVVRTVIVGDTGYGDLPEWSMGEVILVQIPEDFSQLTIYDEGEPVTLELAGETPGVSYSYFHSQVDDSSSLLATVTLWLSDGEPGMLTVYLVENTFSAPYLSYQITYELDF